MSAPAKAPTPAPKTEVWFSVQRKGGALWSLVTETRTNGKVTRSETEPDSKMAQLGRLVRAAERVE